MKISFIALGVLMVGIATVYAMSSSESELQMRYKITINVQTPEGVKSGSAVRAIVIDKFKGFNPDKADFNSKILGEAVVVDLGDKKLFGLLDWDTYNEVFYAFPSDGAPLSEKGIAYYKSLELGQMALLDKIGHWPKMVTFEDLDDPISVALVLDVEHCHTGTKREGQCNEQGPHIVNSRMEEFFGKGVEIKNIGIEITDEPVTREIKAYLPWLEEYKNKKARLNGSTSVAIFTNELSDNLGTGAFSIGDEK